MRSIVLAVILCGMDTFSLIVGDSSGTIVADLKGALDGGNFQSSRVKR